MSEIFDYGKCESSLNEIKNEINKFNNELKKSVVGPGIIFTAEECYECDVLGGAE